MAREGSAALVVRNTIANGLGTVSAAVISLLLTPFLIYRLGIDAFGVWALALSFSFLGGYASMTDLGFETSAARYIAEARSDGDAKAASEIASTAMAFFGAVALVVAPLVAALAYPLTGLFGVPGDLRGAAVACFALVGGQLLFELPARVFFAAIEGAQRYVMYQLIELARALTQAALFVIVLLAGLGVAGLGGALMASSLVVLVVAWVMARRVVPEVHISRHHVSRVQFRKLFTFGGQYFFVRLMGTIYRQMDKAIVGIALGVRFVTFYEIANRIHQAAVMIQSAAASALLPTTAFLRKRTEVLRDLYLRGTNLSVAASLPVVVAAFIFAAPLIRTWIDETLVGAAGSARIFLIFAAFACVHIIGTAMIVALGRMRFVITITVVFTLVNLGVSIALVGPLGVDGVILGTLIAQAVIWVPYTLYFFRTFDVRLPEWLRRVILPNVPGLAAQGLTAAPLLYLANRAGTLIEVGLLVLVSIACSIAAFLLIGMGRDDRAILFGTLRGALGRGGPPAEQEAEPSGADASQENALLPPSSRVGHR